MHIDPRCKDIPTPQAGYCILEVSRYSKRWAPGILLRVRGILVFVLKDDPLEFVCIEHSEQFTNQHQSTRTFSYGLNYI